MCFDAEINLQRFKEYFFGLLDEHGATTDVMKLMMDVYNQAVKVCLLVDYNRNIFLL